METKICSKCGKLFQNKISSHNNQCPDCRRERNNEYYQMHREEILERRKKHYQENKESWLAYLKAYYKNRSESDPEYKERMKKYRKEYYKNKYRTDPEYKERMRRYQNEYQKNKREGDPEYNARIRHSNKICNHKRRSQIRLCIKSGITLNQWKKIIQNQKLKCLICGRKFSKRNPPTMDHIVPLSKVPVNSSDNIMAVCKSCNSSKSNSIDPRYIQSWIYAKEMVERELYNG